MNIKGQLHSTPHHPVYDQVSDHESRDTIRPPAARTAPQTSDPKSPAPETGKAKNSPAAPRQRQHRAARRCRDHSNADRDATPVPNVGTKVTQQPTPPRPHHQRAARRCCGRGIGARLGVAVAGVLRGCFWLCRSPGRGFWGPMSAGLCGLPGGGLCLLIRGR